MEGLIGQVHPQAVKTRAVNDAKDFAAQEVNAATSTVRDADGNIAWDRVAYLAVAVVGTLAFVAVLKNLVK